MEPGVALSHGAVSHSAGDLPTGRETILIVEDNDALRRLACRVLTDLGYVSLVAANANEALRVSNEHLGPVHLLLTDIVMPGADGINLSHRMAAQHPDTRVLFMSGYSGRELAERRESIDRTKLLQKPFTRETLARAVRAVLDEDVARQATPRATYRDGDAHAEGVDT
jgi:DNA-binding NtrC family response regulator